MATLTFTNSFVSGTVAKSSEVNQNFSDVLSWSTTLDDGNFGTLSGPLEWSISSGSLAIDVSNAGSEGSIDILQSVALNSNKASVKVVNAGNDNASSLGAIYAQMTNPSNAQPIIQAQSSHAGPLFKATIDGAATAGFSILKSGSSAIFQHSGTKGGLKFDAGTPIEWDAGFVYLNAPTFFSVVKVQHDAGNLLVDSPIQLVDSSGPRITKSGTNTLKIIDSAVFGSSGTLKLSETSTLGDVNLNVDDGGIKSILLKSQYDPSPITTSNIVVTSGGTASGISRLNSDVYVATLRINSGMNIVGNAAEMKVVYPAFFTAPAVFVSVSTSQANTDNFVWMQAWAFLVTGTECWIRVYNINGGAILYPVDINVMVIGQRA